MVVESGMDSSQLANDWFSPFSTLEFGEMFLWDTSYVDILFLKHSTSLYLAKPTAPNTIRIRITGAAM